MCVMMKVLKNKIYNFGCYSKIFKEVKKIYKCYGI